MTEMKQSCPFCDSAATYSLHKQRKRFTCPKCMPFLIDHWTEHHLGRMARNVIALHAAEMSQLRPWHPDTVMVFEGFSPTERDNGRLLFVRSLMRLQAIASIDSQTSRGSYE
ncbi:hypothetical protein ACFIQG_20185 [Comamonas odontotermitis]|uniref:hypothetical protein n=1 Tax=Comamonas odontotermitis TaxID=379895 RepID=UPI0036732358